MNIGEIIRKSRMAKNMTQEELANVLHVTPQAVSRWETLVSYPDTTMIPKISKTLDVSADILLGCDEADADVKPQETLSQGQIDNIFGYYPVRKEGGKKVLVVDDSDFLRRMLKDILGSEGHSVIEAGNGAEGLKMLEKESVDFCILDINMPVMNGIDALEIIKKRYPEVRTIILSVHCTKAAVEECCALGADSFVAKPFAPDSILKRIGVWNNGSRKVTRSEVTDKFQATEENKTGCRGTFNETIKVLTSRKSCKSYQDRHVGMPLIQNIVAAGLNAPSGRNMQTPIFIIVTDDDVVKKLSRMNAEVAGTSEDPFYGAKDVVVVLAKKECTYLYDGSLAMGNLMNAAWALGVDSRWIHRCKEVFESDEGRELLAQLNITDEVEGIGFCILGYAKEEKEKTEIQQGRVYLVQNGEGE